MALVRNDFTRWIVRESTQLFYDSYTAVPEVWTGLFEERDVATPYIHTNSIIGLGDLEERKESEPTPYDQPTLGWEVYGRVRTFAKGVSFSMELYSDTQAQGLFFDLVRQLADNYPRTRDRFFARFFNEGAKLAGHEVFDATLPGVLPDPTGKFIYDGKPFFADAGNLHPLKMAAGGIQNYFALPLTYENLKTVYTHMTTANNVDEAGNKIVLQPDVLLVPPQLEMEALQILNAEYLPNASGTPSIKNPMYRRFRVVVWHHLTDPDGWFLLQRGKGLKALNRQSLAIDFWQDSDTEEYKGKVVCRFGGYVDNCRFTTACNTPQS